ncbi:MAG: VWA domain-containing protein [Acidobacteriota bacterium]
MSAKLTNLVTNSLVAFPVALLLGCLSLAAWAQSGRKIPKIEDPVLRIETREVLLPINAYDAEGRNVTNLTPRDFLVVENGEPRVITALRHEPANIVLVLDLSNEIGTFKNGASDFYVAREKRDKSARDRPIWVKDYEIVPRPAAREFADNFIRNLGDGDQIAIIQYSDRVQLIQEWTSEREKALDALQSKYRVGLKARYYDALALAAAKLREKPGRRVLVLLSDGLDSASRASRQQSMAAVEHTGASVFVVGWDEVLRLEITGAISWMNAHERQSSSLSKRMVELQRFLTDLESSSYELRSLAEGSGGEMFSPPDFDELVSRIPRNVQRELGAQYSLAFMTERGPSIEPERSVEVLPARPGLSVRSRRTYYVGEDTRQ